MTLAIAIKGTGPGSGGAIESLGGINDIFGAITLNGATTIGSDGGTLTLSGSTISTNGNNLTTAGAGNTIISDTITDNSLTWPTQAYVCFTGSTGGVTSTQQILNCSYASGSTSINDGGGFAGSNLHLNGGATIAGTALKLTDGGGGEARSAFTPTPVAVGAFTSTFQFQITNPGADGFTFAIQNTGPTAVGAPPAVRWGMAGLATVWPSNSTSTTT